MQPLFTHKVQIKSKTTLAQKKVISEQGQKSNQTEKIISDDKAIAEILNKFFINIVPNLKIPAEDNIDHGHIVTDDLVLKTINKFNPIQDGGSGWAKRSLLPVFPPVTSTNVGISAQNFQTLSFNPFATLL